MYRDLLYTLVGFSPWVRRDQERGFSEAVAVEFTTECEHSGEFGKVRRDGVIRKCQRCTRVAQHRGNLCSGCIYLRDKARAWRRLIEAEQAAAELRAYWPEWQRRETFWKRLDAMWATYWKTSGPD